MKKWLWHFVLAGVCLAIASAAIIRSASNGLNALAWGFTLPSWTPDDSKTEKPVDLGIYDPHGAFAKSEGFTIEHLFLDWTTYDSEKLRASMGEAVSKGRWPMLTVEPWPYERTPGQTNALFADIVSGKYDEAIARLCSDINSVGAPLFIRWGHEMEKINGRYAWARNDLVGYVRAYRYFVDTCRVLLKPDAYFVWSPVGQTELFRYWPGPDYVDHIGVSVYEFPEFDLKNHRRPRSFEQIFSEIYERVSLFDKPVIIAELGVTGDERYQRDWMRQAFRSFPKYPKLQAAVYFSAKDSPLAWGPDYSVPDWRISPSILEER